MGKKGHFKKKQKLDILVNAKEIGIKKAADLAGIHYTTVYQGQRKLDAVGNVFSLSVPLAWPCG